MSQPKRFLTLGNKNHVCILKKSLYDLKQSPRQSYKRFDTLTIHQSPHDSCVYYEKLEDDSFVYLLLYVDDMFIDAKNMSQIVRLKKHLCEEFEYERFGCFKKDIGNEN